MQRLWPVSARLYTQCPWPLSGPANLRVRCRAAICPSDRGRSPALRWQRHPSARRAARSEHRAARFRFPRPRDGSSDCFAPFSRPFPAPFPPPPRLNARPVGQRVRPPPRRAEEGAAAASRGSQRDDVPVAVRVGRVARLQRRDVREEALHRLEAVEPAMAAKAAQAMSGGRNGGEKKGGKIGAGTGREGARDCLLYTSPSPRD